MLSFAIRRAALTIPVFIGVATLVFALLHLVPGDPAQAMLGEGASPDDAAALSRRLGLDRPILEQYRSFMTGLVRGDVGTSFRTGEPVASTILERVPATTELALAALIAALAFALPLGVIAAVKRDSAVDHAATICALAGVAMPNFWLGPLLAIVFSVELGWLPVSGRGGWAHLVLPALTLGAALSASLARITRASLLDELREVYVRAARARGFTPARVILRHALRNSLIPIVTIVGLQLGVVLTGAIITETIFSWPGVGRLLVQSIGVRDYPVVQGCVLFIAFVYVSMNLVADLLYGLLDPRIRYQ